jgi:hypothetical protein
MKDQERSTPAGAQPDAPVRQYQPIERFWPYVDLSEQPSDEELASLSLELAAALFGTPPQPFSLTLVFAPFEGPDYARALELATASIEYREVGTGAERRHRARFRSDQVNEIRELWDIVGQFDASEVLIDDQPVPYARELWLPLLWLLDR